MTDKHDFKGAEKATQDWIKCTALSPNQKKVWDAFNKALPSILTALHLADKLQSGEVSGEIICLVDDYLREVDDLDTPFCCSGRECGCHGSSHRHYLEHLVATQMMKENEND